MAYKAMVRNPKTKGGKDISSLQNWMNEYLKEGTDQGWTLHKFNISGGPNSTYIVTMIWETND